MGSASEGFGFNKSKQISEDRVLGSQLGHFGDLFGRAADASKQNTVAGFDPLQLQAQQSAVQAAGGLQPLIDANQQGQQFLASGAASDPSQNPFLARSAQAAINPIFENLTQGVLPGLRGEAAGTGNVGSSRQGIAEGLATQGALDTAGDVSSGIFSNAFGQGLQAQLGALGLGNQTAQLGLLPSQILGTVGGQRQALQQQQLDNPFANLMRFAQILGDPTILNKSKGRSIGHTRNSSGSFLS